MNRERTLPRQRLSSTHCYYRKALRNQSSEYSKALPLLTEQMKKNSDNAALLQKQQYIDKALSEWKQKGSAKVYLDTLSHLSKEEKAEIYQIASMLHKGHKPRSNPYI